VGTGGCRYEDGDRAQGAHAEGGQWPENARVAVTELAAEWLDENLDEAAEHEYCTEHQEEEDEDDHSDEN
jgi:hypothetical protein